MLLFLKKKMKYFYTFKNSTNLLLWPQICRNKPAITPKWFNSLDTNSIPAPIRFPWLCNPSYSTCQILWGKGGAVVVGSGGGYAGYGISIAALYRLSNYTTGSDGTFIHSRLTAIAAGHRRRRSPPRRNHCAPLKLSSRLLMSQSSD